MRLGLIGDVRAKLDVAAPAKELFTSHMFQARRAKDPESPLRFAMPALRSVDEATFLKAVGTTLGAVFGSVRPTDDDAASLAAASRSGQWEPRAAPPARTSTTRCA